MKQKSRTPEKKQKREKKDGELSAYGKILSVLRYFYSVAAQSHKRYFLVGALRILFGALKPFVSLLLLPLIIDELLGTRNVHTLIGYAAVLIIGEILISIADSVCGVILEKYAEIFDNLLTERLGRKVMELDFQLTEDKKALDQVQSAKTGIEWYSGGIHGMFQQLFTMISSFITVLGVILLLLLNAPLLFVVTAVVLAMTLWCSSRIHRVDFDAFGKLSKDNRIFGYLGYEITDIRYGKDIRLYGAQPMLIEKWNTYTQRDIETWRWGDNKRLPFTMISAAAGTVRDIISYLYLGILVIFGKITIGIFSQMLSAGASFHSSMLALVGGFQSLVQRAAYAYEYVKFMNYPDAIYKGIRHVEDRAHTIEFRNVSFRYPNTDVQVLDRINLTLHPEEHLSVVGLNGAGKTTFIKLLCRLYDPTEGEILLDGIDIREYDYEEYLSCFSPVFQDFKLFAFSLRDNIILQHDCDDNRLLTLLKQVGLNKETLTGDTILFKFFDDKGVEPSGGEQQKIAIARSLFKQAPIVILDEPTAALDPLAEYEIYRQFHTLVGGKTAVYISHRLSSCKFCDRIAVFADGKIREYGTHNELVGKEDGIYAGMFAAQAQYYQ